MDEETYLKMLDENPLLWRRPDLMRDSSDNNRDFRFDETGNSKKCIYPRMKTESGNFVGLPRTHEAARHESIYFDAYVGVESIDEEVELQNNRLLEEYKDEEPELKMLV